MILHWLQSQIIDKTSQYIKKEFSREGTGHDWHHARRVNDLAVYIAKHETNVDIFIVQLAAWLHDIKDWKFTRDANSDEGAELARKWLKKCRVDEVVIEKVCQIVQNISYKNSFSGIKMTNIEGMIVQDADRLDAIGAIGVSRVMTYGGFAKRPIYDPQIAIGKIETSDDYIKSGNTSINHVYEKILKLKDQMNTQTAKELAEVRHKFIEDFLAQFFREWTLVDIK